MISYISLTLLLLFAYTNTQQQQIQIPNPQVSPKLCGMLTDEPSSICDPDFILTQETKNYLVGMVDRILTQTKSPCDEQNGFKLSVVIIKKAGIQKHCSTSDKECNVRQLARSLHDQWGIGKKGCNDGLLFLVSVTDREMYISLGETSEKYMRQSRIDKVLSAMTPYLKKQNYNQAMVTGTERIFELLKLGEQNDQLSNAEVFWLCLFIVMILICLCWNPLRLLYSHIKRGLYRNSEYYECQKRLQEIEQLKRQEDEKTHRFNASTCPICLEQYSQEVYVMPCRHKFDKKCLQDALASNDVKQCPICRTPMDRDEHDVLQEEQQKNQEDMVKWRNSQNQQSQQQRPPLSFYNQQELEFRLFSLRRRYPSYITHQLVADWAQPYYAGTFENDQRFRVLDPAPIFKYEERNWTAGGTGRGGSTTNRSSNVYGGGSSRGGGGGSW